MVDLLINYDNDAPQICGVLYITNISFYRISEVLNMGRGRLSDDEIRILKDNPYVDSIDGDRIIYSDRFKHHFMGEYNKGKKPTQIFREAGFDPVILGSKRIERATASWKESYRSGALGGYSYHMRRSEKPAVTLTGKNKETSHRQDVHRKKTDMPEKEYQEKLLEKQREIDELKAEIERLKGSL